MVEKDMEVEGAATPDIPKVEETEGVVAEEIPKADVINDVAILAKIKKYAVKSEIDSGNSNILFFKSVRRRGKVTRHFSN